MGFPSAAGRWLREVRESAAVAAPPTVGGDPTRARLVGWGPPGRHHPRHGHGAQAATLSCPSAGLWLFPVAPRVDAGSRPRRSPPATLATRVRGGVGGPTGRRVAAEPCDPGCAAAVGAPLHLPRHTPPSRWARSRPARRCLPRECAGSASGPADGPVWTLWRRASAALWLCPASVSKVRNPGEGPLAHWSAHPSRTPPHDLPGPPLVFFLFLSSFFLLWCRASGRDGAGLSSHAAAPPSPLPLTPAALCGVDVPAGGTPQGSGPPYAPSPPARRGQCRP